MINAAITPGIQHSSVSKVTITMDPHPLSSTASGGNIMASIALSNDIIIVCLII